MTPEQAASKFISNIQLYNDRAPELVEALTILIHAQRAEAVAEAQKWRPIETAPTDTSYWAFVHFKSLVSGQWEMGEAFNCHGEWTMLPMTDLSYTIHPTHWQPLSAPPVQEGER